MARASAGRITGLAGLALAALVVSWHRSLETIVLRTGVESGARYQVSLWVAEEGFDLWVESPDSECDWYAALMADPLVEVERSGRTERFRAQAAPEARARVERLQREKYGVAHALRGLIAKRGRRIPIRLARMPDAGTRA
jgi:hypothetical protein